MNEEGDDDDSLLVISDTRARATVEVKHMRNERINAAAEEYILVAGSNAQSNAIAAS